jgi:hypothetical protein
VALVGMLTNALLVIGQVAVGIVCHSQALVADGMHTLADLSSDLLVLYALKHSAKEADEEHPYGHARFETAVTLVLGVLLLMVGIGIAACRLAGDMPFWHPPPLPYGYRVHDSQGAIPVYLAARRLIRTCSGRPGTTVRMRSLQSSFTALPGIAGAGGWMPWPRLVWYCSSPRSASSWWPAISELVDTGLDTEQLRHIRRTILGVDGVRALHLLRTRRIGGRALVDVHIIVDEDISVSEGHYISEMVRTRLVNEVDVVADALVHIDPEDDTHLTPARDLPSRSAVHALLNTRFKDIDAAAHIERITCTTLATAAH